MSTSKIEFKDSTYLDNAFPASERVYIPGELHRSVRVPLREVLTKDGARVRVYDTRGPWGDPDELCDVRQGLRPLRLEWIVDRGDTAEYEGRAVRPEDNGYLSFKHAAHAAQSQGRVHLESFPGLKRPPRKAAHHPLPTCGRILRRCHSEIHHSRVRPQRGCARARDYSGEHQSSGIRADDHRPEFSGQDQFQHR